ncbi:hypothetical protein [Bradymonas sediminis]|uniref:Uncharacterized protein n=1 Tax=Bradymonas sediminis TaxID=1548548 RepID=A0A2Z4FPR3_9DELT|nr:hypothetical protein [Bradymonas sediminis]AWV90614.1 hypothetical protein DN745_15290 [Bradymonas sediminis]TDP62388.1 hypothetical protein DFR33_11351 [Bradymonas sediminis]
MRATHSEARGAKTPARRGAALCLIWLGALLFIVAGPAGLSAQAPPAPKPASLVISPHFQVFADFEDADAAVRTSRAFYQGAADFARRQHDTLYLVSQSDLQQAVRTARGYDYRLTNAELATRLGIDSYTKLDVASAATYLESAFETYQELNYGLVDPERVAEVALYLALSYIEQDRTTLKLFDRLQTMTLLDPARRIRPGYYPDDVVRIYDSARESLVTLLRDEGPQTREAAALAEFSDTDFAAFGYAWPTERGTFEATLYVYSQSESRFLPPESIEIADLDPATLRAAGNRLMSRFLPCLIAPPQPTAPASTVVTTNGASPFSLDFGFAYTSFMQYPYQERARTQPWGNYGLSVAGRLQLTHEFSLVLGAQLLNSMRDYAGFVFDDFSIARGFFGGDLGVSVGAFNFGAQLSLEGSSLGSFYACPDINAQCAERADRNFAVRIDNDSLFVGANVRPRIIWNAYRQFSLIASGSASYYFVPLSRRNFNIPLSGQLDVSYRF